MSSCIFSLGVSDLSDDTDDNDDTDALGLCLLVGVIVVVAVGTRFLDADLDS